MPSAVPASRLMDVSKAPDCRESRGRRTTKPPSEFHSAHKCVKKRKSVHRFKTSCDPRKLRGCAGASGCCGCHVKQWHIKQNTQYLHYREIFGPFGRKLANTNDSYIALKAVLHPLWCLNAGSISHPFLPSMHAKGVEKSRQGLPRIKI